MKKRFLAVFLVLALLIGVMPVTSYAAETELNVEFGKFQINQDYVTSARISGALVNSVKQLDAQPEEGENNRLHFLIELGKETKDGDVIQVEFQVSEQWASGGESALKSEIVEGVGFDEDDRFYDVTIEGGKGSIRCYSFYNVSEYTTVILDFVVGDESLGEYNEPYEMNVNDHTLNWVYIWGADVMKTMATTTHDDSVQGLDYNNHVILYIWLEEYVSDNARVGLELRRGWSNLLEAPFDWGEEGGYVTLKDGEGTVSFYLQGLGGSHVGNNRRITVYIKNHMSEPPVAKQEQVAYTAEVDVPYTLNFKEIFSDYDTDALTYTISVNGGEDKTQTGDKYRFIPTAVGDTVLTVSASDGVMASGNCVITVTAQEDHVWSDWTVVSEATCLENGSQRRFCTCCGKKENQEIAAAGEHTWSDWKISLKPNCMDDGKEIRGCLECGEMESRGVKAGEHDWVVTTTATCGQAGVDTYTCSACGKSETKEAPATGKHTWGKWEVTTAATCVDDGVESAVCSVCNETKTQNIEKTGVHTWSGWVVSKKPTCVETGEETRKCQVCSESDIRQLDATGSHNWGEWKITVAPSAVKDGEKIRVCADCGTEQTDIVMAGSQGSSFAYVTISVSGGFKIVRAPVTLEDRNGSGYFDVDDVLTVAHELYSDANHPYRSTESDELIQVLWGDGSGSFGYYLNDKQNWSLKDAVTHGDDVYAFVYQSPMWDDMYSWFDRKVASVGIGEEFTLTLNMYALTAMYEQKLVPSVGAKVLIDGEDSGLVTDSNGNVTLSFNKDGQHTISAVGDGYIITPPVCVVTVGRGPTALTAPALLEGESTTTTITVTPPENSEEEIDAVVEYSISTDQITWSMWQKSNTFADLLGGKEYYIRARYTASDFRYFSNSPASEILTVRTKGEPTVIYTLGNVSAVAGQTVQIPVSIETSGISVARFNMAFQFDKEMLTMNGVTGSDQMSGWNVKSNLFTKTAYGTSKDGSNMEITDGEMLYVSLTVSPDAIPGEYYVSLSDTWNVGVKNTFWDASGRYLRVVGSSNYATITVVEKTEETIPVPEINVPDTEPDAKEPEQVISVTPSETFSDVQQDSWYTESVNFAVGGELMIGTNENEFAPNGITTRAQFAMLLYRMEGEPSVDGLNNPFRDVSTNAWYYDAVVWAADCGVVKGVSEDSFDPNAPVTREQFATMLYRYVAKPDTEGSLNDFADAASVSAYAVEAMAWAVETGMIQGDTQGNLNPRGNAKRAEAATILMRFYENI